MLALSGTFDMRTPTANAASVVSQFPQGHLLVVPGIGHSVLTTDPSALHVECGARMAERKGRAGPVPAHAALPRDVPRIPLSVAKAPIVPGDVGPARRTRCRSSRRQCRTRSPPR